MAAVLMENRQPAHSACDLCYARKIKCDREDPCGNCIDSKVKCLRTRQKRVGRPRQNAAAGGDGKPESISDRLARLENSVTRLAAILSNQKTPTQDGTSNTASAGEYNSQKTIPQHSGQTGRCPADDIDPTDGPSSRPSKRARLEHSASPTMGESKREPDSDRETSSARPRATSPENDLTRATQVEARKFIQGALADTSQNISIDRRSVLEAALEFVSKMEQLPTRQPFMSNERCVEEIADCLAPPPLEFFYQVYSEIRRSGTRAFDMAYSTYILPNTLEMMALALHEKSESDQTLIQYAVCVNGAIDAYLARLLQDHQSAGMQRALEKSRENYQRRCFTALNYISILEKPTLSLLQALVTAIVQLQHLGETPTCWLLTSNAARVCVALGLHNSSQFVLPSEELTEEQRELKNCFLWCYMFDKGLSMSLGRPVCMPVWDVPEDVIAPIEPDRPRSTVIQMLLKYAKIQAIISRDLYYQPTQLNSPQRKEAAIASLRRKMSKIQQQADEIRTCPPHTADTALEREWIYVEFMHHATLTVILRFDTGVVSDAMKREECLQHARKTFIAIRDLKTHIETRLDGQSFAYFLPWTALYLPLHAYFVLFCNVVATSHARDFQLMKEFADSLMSLPNLNAAGHRLAKLCTTLVNLCQPLIQQSSSDNPPNGETNGSTTTDYSLEGQRPQNGMPGEGIMPMMPNTTFNPWFQRSLSGTGAAAVSGAPSTSSSDEMILALFDVQPTLDWLGADVFGQGSNWSGFDGGFGGA
ncbi:hypothetical protein B0J12DRAFT_206187 [Macrophomina phaseolina]|uniref:Zn(2)-C6 fungal-type domain-containing protein n=1 Tax=Macrophomina phaseolina TaxID=35725 RepID=A0ABQ8G3B4_9PEZI|nr:hypothetical protein B0J12DRAFT_206187 [Macrophomina phaseolina]